MKIALYGKAFSSEQIEYFKLLVQTLEDKGCQLHVWKPFFEFLKDKIIFNKEITLFSDNASLGRDAEILFSVGGDGTLLDAVRVVRNSGIPVAGINLGRMGFLSGIQRTEIIPAIGEILDGRYNIVKRSLIALKSPSLFKDVNFAFNELSINKKDTSSMVVVHVWINGEFLHSYWADGLIIATPTGSTAYSLSCNGPIITPDSANFVITPIAPHNLSVRPVVIPDSSQVRVKVDSRDNQALICLDSQSAGITPETELVIAKADFEINLIQRYNDNFFSTIRTKLNWGMDIRN